MLQPYNDSHFPLLQRWITDPGILLLYSGATFTYPLTRQQLQDYTTANPGRQFYIGHTEDGEPFALGEIIPQQINTPRLGRLLVGDAAQRCKGLGQRFVKQLVAECVRLYDPPAVDLYVWDKNDRAIACYTKVGFTFTADEPYILNHEGSSYTLLKMTCPTG